MQQDHTPPRAAAAIWCHIRLCVIRLPGYRVACSVMYVGRPLPGETLIPLMHN